MEKTLKERMNIADTGIGIKVDEEGIYCRSDEGKYRPVITVINAVKVAEQYALQEQISLLETIIGDAFNKVGTDVYDKLSELREQLKPLNNG